jgi:predicted TIM-barrel fold metal-dependent hydrolase
MRRRNFISGCIGAAAWFMMQSGPTAYAADSGARAAVDDYLASEKARGHRHPIIDTHIHFYQPSRPGGVPWPDCPSALCRDVLPPEYKALAAANGIVASGVIEASPLVADNQWIQNLLGRDKFFIFFAGQLEIGSSGFIANLNRLSADPRFVGIRGYLWGPAEGITLSTAQLRDLRELARRGMTLDIISRADKNPKDQVEALCTTVPNLKIIIDHLGGAKGPPPVDRDWEFSIRRLADVCPNLYMKFSSFYDMYAPGDVPFLTPTDLPSYKAHFDVLRTAFGPDRLIWGSNWPVAELHGTIAGEIRLAEDYLAPLGETVRDKVMFRNALMFYRRHVPGDDD